MYSQPNYGTPGGYGVPLENTSGQGPTAVVPPEVRGWNWGAFLLNWIWGIGNSVWLALICLIPCVGFIFAFVLGVKGSEWAWQSKRWESVEAFKATQRKWAMAGIILWVAMFGLYCVLFGLSAVLSSLGSQS